MMMTAVSLTAAALAVVLHGATSGQRTISYLSIPIGMRLFHSSRNRKRKEYEIAVTKTAASAAD
jgi:hypothetical protein